ncbi:MAG: DUF4445 domain-containing protein [Chloroflexi bacterium]|nr:DUF4445 domain-containing protein [Chloroflexota bacterium]
MSLPALVGGFVGSHASVCVVNFPYAHPSQPMLAIDLNTNGEVMVTDKHRNILVASPMARPAFEGVNVPREIRPAADSPVEEAPGFVPPRWRGVGAPYRAGAPWWKSGCVGEIRNRRGCPPDDRRDYRV